ncbi:MAG: pectinacetylesterase family protein [Myxococcales bacterium]|nr:pectinacetylesterase family protein [Myxococcales bacterium]
MIRPRSCSDSSPQALKRLIRDASEALWGVPLSLAFALLGCAAAAGSPGGIDVGGPSGVNAANGDGSGASGDPAGSGDGSSTASGTGSVSAGGYSGGGAAGTGAGSQAGAAGIGSGSDGSGSGSGSETSDSGSNAGGGGVGGPEGHDNATVDPVGNANRAPGFVDLSPPMGDPIPMTGDSVTPAPPAGWTWHNIEGAVCRDGSDTGFYLHRGTGDGLLIYFEGGGACSNDHYCAFNPANANQVLAGDGQVVLGSALGAGAGRQQPGVYTDGSHLGAPAGVFDVNNSQNPFRDWSQVYIPYCTGDVHFGTNPAGMVPNLPTTQKFVGYYNTRKFIGRIVPTFKDSVSKVVVAGSSAGGFGAALNFSMVQDAFGDVPVMVVDDSGPPFENDFMPVCMQKKWRATWGLNEAMPPDCDDCRDPQGGNMLRLSDFLMDKHPTARIAIISSMQDEVIRLFYSVGLLDCQNYDTADPVAVVLFQGDPNIYFPPGQYENGLKTLRTTYESTGRFATYYMGGINLTFHQHLFRPRFYEAPSGGKTIAQFTADFINGTVQTVGP